VSALSSCLIALVLTAGGSVAFAQGSAAPPPPARAALNFDALPQPPVPADPLELVIGAAQAVDTPEKRLAAIAAIERARDLSNVRAQSYDLKTSFTSTGGSASDGSWALEDISPARGIYRWTAQGPAYSVINLYTNSTHGILYSNQPAGVVPLRLEQVREALFFVYPQTGPQASIRTATGYLNGVQQNCFLIVNGFRGPALTGARNWQEAEYCADAATGLLTTYSPVPGLVVHYDYSGATSFHGKTIAGAFTITEGGRIVIEARTLGVSDPPDPKNPIFDSAGLISLGVGREMTPASRVRGMIPNFNFVPGAAPAANPVVQVVALHGNAGPDGKLTEVGILASSDPSMNQAALDRTANWGTGNRSQPGATAQSNEVFFTWEFVNY
jgi:hypothetical protein